ncbi:unnamed protein product [marine sediment metagenome]|uniref:Uncharacterized protein n=1 Tax=marine sediment metagenome TaxID=412755 RepID=X1UXZ5_9ZZZZ
MGKGKLNPNQVMQLPDCCFGPRWWIGEYMGSSTGVAYTRKGQELLPQRFVLWGILVSSRSPACLEALRLTIRLAGDVAADTAAAKLQDRLLDGISTADILYELYVNQNGVDWINCGRQLIESRGRRLSLVSNGDQVIAYEMTVGILVSAVPTEIPDWLVNARGVL